MLVVNTSTEDVHPTTVHPSKTLTTTQKQDDTKINEDEKKKSTQCRVSHRLGEYRYIQSTMLKLKFDTIL